MRVAALVLLLVASCPAFAAHTVTAAQLEQQLAALRGKPDDEFARFLGEFQLSERVTPAQLTDLQSKAPGEKSRLIPLARPAPDVAEQRRVMGLTVAYVSNAIPQLPNFIATRVTTRFEDTPLIQKSNDSFTPYEPIHPLGTETTPILYDDGRETVQLRAKSQSAEGLRTDGLRTWGVFGPILGTVLVDAAQSRLAWARWDEEPDGLRAVSPTPSHATSPTTK